MATLTRGGWLTLFRTLSPPPLDSDADLLARFVSERSEAALDALIRRYAGMVMGVCRRRLGDTADADDAFQATFLVLAKTAGSVSRGTSLPAWLHRVAYLTSLKLAGQLHRRGTAPMEDEPIDRSAELPEWSATRNEQKSVLDEELSALPEKFRGPVVLCCLEGKTNIEAAVLLGIPVGTVDSRLHSAKEKLRSRLTKRGVAGAALSLSVPAGVGASDELIQTTVRAAMAYAVGSEIAGPLVTTLAREVSSTMTTMKFKLLASAAMIVTLAGGVGTGVYFANAGDDPQKPSAKAKADPTKKADEKPRAQITEISNETAATIPTVSRTTAETTQLLSRPVPEEIVQDVNYQVGELFTLISNKFGITVRAEDEYLKNMGIDSIYEKTVRFRFNPNKLSLEDLLTEIKSQIRLEPKVGFRVKANQLIFGHVYSLCTQSLSNQKNNPDIDQTEIIKDMHGPRISISVEGKSLSDIAEYLREQTGANIIINSRQHVNLDNKKVTVTLNNATVYTILKVVSDLYNLAPAIVDNVYYITDIKAAEKLNRETAIALFGEEIPMVVYVPVNQDGKFMPPGPEGFRSQKFKFIPVRVEEVDKAKDTAKPKVEEKKP